MPITVGVYCLHSLTWSANHRRVFVVELVSSMPSVEALHNDNDVDALSAGSHMTVPINWLVLVALACSKTVEVPEKWAVAALWLRTSSCTKWSSSNLLLMLINACAKALCNNNMTGQSTNPLIDQINPCCWQQCLLSVLLLFTSCALYGQAFAMVLHCQWSLPLVFWMWINPHGWSSYDNVQLVQSIPMVDLLFCGISTELHAPSQRIIFSNCWQKHPTGVCLVQKKLTNKLLWWW